MWLFAFVSAVCVLYIVDPYKDVGPTHLGSVFYLGLHRVAWTFSLGWVVFACFHGYGGEST